ncbi:hypothetical protein [Pedobacter jamesrossensis]|uniref:DUF4306 domain-containing protein n=1 Tax=Pedobacter jamesrossensis TaxID=1908238 RepID=A0ABV8NKE4_9SPHI
MKIINLNIVILLSILITWLFVGIKADDEFGGHSTFFKYKPSFQVYFKSPLGMQDMPANYPSELVTEEALYDDFVNKKHFSDNCILPYLADVFILITISLIGLKGYQLIKKSKHEEL